MGVSWLKTGADSAKLAVQDAAEKEAAEAQKGNLWRFFLRDKEEARITFVDGTLDKSGHLNPPRYYEHSIQIAGKWGNFFICPEKTIPEAHYKCGLCAMGERSSLVALFTVIDHREFKTKAGKLISNQRRLFVAKTITLEMLSKIAVKRGGLANCTFDVSRMGDTSAAVGSMFDFVEKNESAKLEAAFTEIVDVKGAKVSKTSFYPSDYEKEMVFRTPEEMAKELDRRGYSSFSQSGSGSGGFAGSAPSTDYSKEL